MLQKLGIYYTKVKSMSTHRLFAKVYRLVLVKIKGYFAKHKDYKKNTRTTFLYKGLNTNCLIHIRGGGTIASYLSQMYTSHNFDLLGSGWVRNSYDSKPLGVEGHTYHQNVRYNLQSQLLKPHLKEALNIAGHISSDYQPIDWQKDYKSGFRWDESKWYKEQRIGNTLGADIKVPWEVARLQHLPQLAIFAQQDETLVERNILEFKNQVLDFISANPPRMGVNWVCTMDVGIRIANILLAYNMFKPLDSKDILDDTFDEILSQSTYEHGVHIVNNLEYSPELRSNHYLSDIAGLLFVANYLESNRETDQWLAFAVQEIVSEFKAEYYEDGGNFESSTSYHRLGSELIIYSTALILGMSNSKVSVLEKYSHRGWKVRPKLKPLNQQEYSIKDNKVYLPEWYIERLYRVALFTQDISKPNKEIIQFGDNDSGRFFRLSPNGQFMTNKEAEEKYLNLKGYISHTGYDKDDLYWDENILNHQTLLSAFNGLYKDKPFKTEFSIEEQIIDNLSQGRKIPLVETSYLQPSSVSQVRMGEFSHEEIVKADPLEGDLTANLQVKSYPNSGIYIFRSDRLHLAINAMPNGQSGNGGHCHNDRLSFELFLDGKSIVRDPGTYLYTPIPERRNEFRKTQAHHVPYLGEEQNTYVNGRFGLFSMNQDIKVEIYELLDNGIKLGYVSRGKFLNMKLSIQEHSIQIQYDSNIDFESPSKLEYLSTGYGKLEKSV